MSRPYQNKYGTPDDMTETFNDLFLKSTLPNITDTDDVLDSPKLTIDLDEIDEKTEQRATTIAEKLSAYYFDQKYIDKHPYITNKIEQEIDNIRRLLKMLAVNEKAQDSLICSITLGTGKGSLYTSLTSLQDSMLKMQAQLNQLTTNLEDIFKEMQENCEKTFEEKDKDENNRNIVRGSREFIEEMTERIARKNKLKREQEQKENKEQDSIEYLKQQNII